MKSRVPRLSSLLAVVPVIVASCSCARPVVVGPAESSPAGAARNTCGGALSGAARGALASVAADRGEVAVLELPSARSLARVTHGSAPAGHRPPASTIKPFLALAALEAGVVGADEALPCGGAWSRDGLAGRCFASHPPQTVESALATSCNAYFLEVAARLGPDKLADQLAAVGLHDLAVVTREASGGDYLAIALGHGAARVDLDAYALAHARLLASGSPHLGRVLAGMRRAFDDEEGSAHEVRVDGVALAGKTGTGQEDGAEHADAWLVAHAPAGNPEVLVVSHVVGAGTGATLAGPVVQAVLEAWRDACSDRSES